MSDASTGQTVECPICGESFDPTVAGGWCTNTECGEWQYTADEGDASDETDDQTGEGSSDSDDDLLSQAAEEATTEDETPPPADATTDTDSQTSDTAESGAAQDTVDDEPLSDPVTEEDAPDAGEATAPDESEDATTDTPSEADDLMTGTTDEAAADSDADDASTTAGGDSSPTDAPAETDDDPSTIDCPDCGTELDGDANFCVACGTDVQDVEPAAPLTECPSCGTEVGETDSFCVECGENLDAHRDGAESDDTEETDESEAAEQVETTETETTADDAVEALAAQSEDEADVEPVPDSLVLEVRGREIPVEDGDTVGREIRAALTDAGRPEDEAVRVHREHVRFVRESDAFYLVDLGDNPTSLNGRPLQKGDREPVAPDDELELSGVATVTVRAP